MCKPASPPAPAEMSSDGPRSITDEVPHLHDPGAESVIPLLEEEVRLEKRQVTTGKVRVRTVVDVVEETVGTALREETVEITRIPVDREIDQVPHIRTENDVTIVPVVGEVIVVEKRLVLKEELHIYRRTRTERRRMRTPKPAGVGGE